MVTYALVAGGAAAFAWQLGVGVEASAFRGGAIPFEVLTATDVDLPALVPPPLTVLTAMFLHSGLVHAVSNLLVLAAAGGPVEDALGRRRFLACYLGAGVVASLAQIVVAAAAGDLQVPVVGASGAIAGVLAAHVTLFPRATLHPRLPLRTAPVVFAWLAVQVLSLVLGGNPRVAFVAHVAGFAAGWLLVRVVGRRRTRTRRASG
jgi:membrane associated rhomboid family serine protease